MNGRTTSWRDAWPLRHLDDLLVVAFVAACFGASLIGVVAGVPVVPETIALGVLLVFTLLIVQYARHTRRRRLPTDPRAQLRRIIRQARTQCTVCALIIEDAADLVRRLDAAEERRR